MNLPDVLPDRVVGYARYSTDRQTENSIEYQLAAIKQYCEENKIKLYKCYIDPERSGSNVDRPGFQELLFDARQGLVSKVIIYDISRGSRDIVDWFMFRKEMMALDVEVISVTQRLGDLTNPSDYIQELIQAGMAQFGLLDTRKKTMDGLDSKAKKGLFLGGVPPLGYDIVDGRYVINESEAWIVRKAFAMYADGFSYNKIIDALKGAKGKRGKPIGKNTLYDMFRNKRYIGIYTWNVRQVKFFGKWAGGKPNPRKVEIPGIIPPIIDMDTWERVRKRVSDSKRNGRNSAKRTYLLSGLIVCGECGTKYVGRTSTNKKGYQSAHYHCGNKYRTRTCKAKNINANVIETFVVSNLKDYLLKIDYQELAERVADQINNASPNLEAEKKELAIIDNKIHNGVKAILSGIRLPELEEELDRLRTRKAELEDVIRYTVRNRITVTPDMIVEFFKQTICELEGHNMRRVIERHVQKIEAHADGSFDVYVGLSLPLVAGAGNNPCLQLFRYRAA